MKEFLSLDRNVKLRLLSMLVTELVAYSIYGNVIIYYKQYFGEFTAGIFMAITAISSFLIGFYGGHFADEKGRKAVMKIGLTIDVIGYFLAAMLNSPNKSYPLLTFFVLLIVSMSFNFTMPAFEAMIIDVTTPKNRHFVYSLTYWIQNLCVMFGVAIGAWLFQNSLFILLLIAGVGSIWGWFIVIVLMDETKPVSESKEASLSVWAAVRNYGEAFKDKRYLLFMVGFVCSAIIFVQPEYSFATHLKDDFQTIYIFGTEIYGQRMRSLMVLINTVVIFGTLFGLNRWTKNRSPLKRYILGSVLHGIGSMFVMLFNTWLPLVFFTVVFTIGEATLVPASQSIRVQLMNPKKIGVYSGAFGTAMPLGQFLAGLIVSGSAFFGNWGVAIILGVLTFFRIFLMKKSVEMPSSF